MGCSSGLFGHPVYCQAFAIEIAARTHEASTSGELREAAKGFYMRYDIGDLLNSWPFDPDEFIARRITARDGSEKVQIRIDMGMLQLELEGRPDGQKPHGCESLLEFYRAAQKGRVARVTRDGVLDEEACEDLFQEAWQYYQRYLALFYLEDYASLILALLALYQTDSNLRWYTEAQKLGEEMVAHFSDPAGGFFDTRDDHEALLLRPKDLQDNATPSGNALAATALLQLAAYELNTQWHDRAEAMLAALAPNMARYPTGFAQWLCACDLAIGPSREVAILGERNHPETQQLIDALWQSYRPRTLSAHSPYPAPAAAPEILKNRPLQNIRPTAYVCQGYTCKNPVNTPAEMLAHLNPDSDA